jgi:hypothetical protein
MFKAVSVSCLAFLIFQGTKAPKDQQPDSASLQKCDQQRVLYRPFDEAYSKRIVWQSVSNSENPPARVKNEYSPERTKWSVTVDPDTTKPGPWNTQVYFGSDADEEVWKLTLNDNAGTEFKWLSEKLVFGRIWWGRIYATDFVLDLEAHKFLYKEMAHYGDMIQPCE